MIKESKNDAFFANWLTNEIDNFGLSKTKLADECHLTRKTVYNHCKGYQPKFTDVVVYCWYFRKLYGPNYHWNPEKVWSRVTEEFDIL